MASYWVWALVAGGIIMVGGLAASRLTGDRRAPIFPLPATSIALSISLPAIALLLCLPHAPPFARGEEMGYGALLGLGAALIAIIVLRLARLNSFPAAHGATLASLGGAAIAWVAITQLLFPGDPTYALYGGTAGALLALLPWLREAGSNRAVAALEFFGLAVLAQGLGAVLVIARYSSAAERSYWGLPALALSGGLLGAIIAALLVGRARGAAAAAARAAVIIAVGFGVWLGGGIFARAWSQGGVRFRSPPIPSPDRGMGHLWPARSSGAGSP